MKLVLYSGGDDEDNALLDKETLNVSEVKDPLFVFIPADSYDGESGFRDVVARFRKIGVKRFLYFPIDIPFDNVLYQEILKADIFFLGGGNTYYFIKNLREKKLLRVLKNQSRLGKTIAGVSAGAILMTPTIESASYPKFDRDENDDDVTNMKAMGLVSFEFFPHYKNSERYDNELKKQSRKLPYPLYALPDGSGVIKHKEKMTFVGKVWCFFKGQKINLSGRKVLSK